MEAKSVTLLPPASGSQLLRLHFDVPDELMPQYVALTTGWDAARVAEVTDALTSGDLAPVDAKRLLARTVVDLYHADGAGAAAEREFDRVFKAHEVPADIVADMKERVAGE